MKTSREDMEGEMMGTTHDKKEKIEVGQIWRKQGPHDWLRIDRILDPEYDEYDGGCPGAVITSIQQLKTKLKYGKTFFVADSIYGTWEDQITRNRFLFEPKR